MRVYFEIVSAEVENREYTNKRTGEVEAPEILVIHGIDVDFPQQLYKLQIWEHFQKVLPDALKGAVLEVIFRGVRPANQYEKLDQITAAEDNIRVVKTAADALKEMAAQLQKRANVARQPEKEAAVTN